MSILEILEKVQTEISVPKNRFNKFGNYNFRNAEDILEAIKPLLLKYKCVLLLNDEIVNIGNRFYIKATAILKNNEGEISTCAYAREDEDRKGFDVCQLTGSTSSYARKYALNGLLCLDDNKDADNPEVTIMQQKSTPKKVEPKKQEPIKEEPKKDATISIAQILDFVNNASSKEDLKYVWNNYKFYDVNGEIKVAVIEKGKQFD